MWKKILGLLVCCFVVQSLQADTWNVDTNGNWATASNWSTSIVPNSPTATATFGNAITAPRTISIGTANQVQNLTFDSAFSYTLANTGGSLTVGDTITFTSGSHTIETDMTFGPTMTINQNSVNTCSFTGNLSGDTLLMRAANRNIETTFTGFVDMSTAISIDASTLVLESGSSISDADISLANLASLVVRQNMTLFNDITVTTSRGIFNVSAGNTATLVGAISGDPGVLSLNFTGPGTIRIPVNNTITTPISISNDAIVVVGDDLSLGTAPITLNNNGTLANDATRTLNNAIQQTIGPGSINAAPNTEFIFNTGVNAASTLVLTGPGTKTLNGAATTTGTIELAEGLTRISIDTAFGTGQLSLNGGALGTVGDRTIANPIAVDADSFFTPDTATTLTINGIISGTNGLTFNGAGTTILTQANTYAGTTTLSSGITAMGNDAAFGANTISLNGGTLNNNATNRTIGNAISVDAPSTIDVAAGTGISLNGAVSGTEALSFTGEGTKTFGVANGSYSGQMTITAGTVIAIDDVSFGTADVTLSGATFTTNAFNHTFANNFAIEGTSQIVPLAGTTLLLNGVLSGAGNITVPASASVLSLTGNNTLSGTLLFQNDNLTISNDNAFGTATVTFDGTGLTTNGSLSIPNNLVLNQDTGINPQTNDLALLGNISGTGALNALGTAGTVQTLTLAGTNTYGGTTTLTDLNTTILTDAGLGGGDLTLNSSVLNADGTFSSTRNINLNTTTGTEKSGIAVTANNVFTTTGNLTGTDGFIKSGAGELIFSNDQPNISGAVSVTEGTFTINGALANATLTASNTGIIGGTGSAGNTIINSGRLKGNGTYTNVTMNAGTIAPGDSIGMITITGNYVQNTGAVYEVEIEGTLSDQIIVTGNAMIQNGAILTILEPTGTILEGTTYDILTATNIDQLWTTVNLPNSLEFSLDLVAGDTIARLTALSSTSFLNEELDDGNSTTIANYINTIEITGNRDLTSLIMSIESDPENLTDSLNQLHHGRFGAFEITNVEANYTIISTIDRHNSSFLCAQPNHNPNSVWLAALGAKASREQRQDLRGSNNKDIGAVLGYDYSINNIVLGLSGGYLHTDLNWDKLGGHAIVQKGFASIYTAYNNSRFQGMLCLMGGGNFYNTDRRIAFADFDRTAKSTNTSGFFSSNIGAKADLLGTPTTVILQGNIGYHYLSQGSFKETDAESLNLIIDSRTSHFLRAQLGAQFSGKIEGHTECIRYYVGGNWVNKSLLSDHELSGKLLFFEQDTPSFRVSTNDKPINSFLAEAGLELSTNTNRLSLAYQGEFANKDQNHQVQASIGFRF